MRILHINTNYPYNVLHRNMIKAMPAGEAEHFVFAPVRKGSEPLPDTTPNVYSPVCYTVADRFLYFNKRRKLYHTLEKLLDLRSFGLLHAYTLFTDGDIAYRVHKKYGTPYAVAIRNSDVNFFFRWFFFLQPYAMRILENAETIFFLSDAYRREVFSRYIPSDKKESLYRKTAIIPNGIDTFWHSHVPEESVLENRTALAAQEPLPLLFAGTLDRNKNPRAIVEAMAILEKRGVKTRLTMVGKIKSKRYTEQLLQAPGVTYHEPMTQAPLLEQYRSHAIFVMPSYHETFGLVYAEALSQGMPVIYTRGQGFDGHFPEGSIGKAVEADRPEEIADAILTIRDAFPSIQHRCLAASQRFYWEKIDMAYMEIYKKSYGKSTREGDE